MHPYVTDSRERSVVSFYIIITSIGLSIGLTFLFGLLIAFLFGSKESMAKLIISWLFTAPTAWGLYTILHSLFNHVLWKKSFLTVSGLLKCLTLEESGRGFLDHLLTNLPTKLRLRLRSHKHGLKYVLHLQMASHVQLANWHVLALITLRREH